MSFLTKLGFKRKATAAAKVPVDIKDELKKLSEHVSTFWKLMRPGGEELAKLRWCSGCEDRLDEWRADHDLDYDSEGEVSNGPQRPSEPFSAGEYLVKELDKMQTVREHAIAFKHGALCFIADPCHFKRQLADQYRFYRDKNQKYTAFSCEYNKKHLAQGMFSIDGKPFVATEETCAKLIDEKRASQSPYGDLRDFKTHMDAKVRYAYEVPAKRIDFSTPLKEAIKDLLGGEDVKKMFGLGLKAELNKMNLYPPGGHFRPHKDTPHPETVGSMVLEFCYMDRKGGDLVFPSAAVRKDKNQKKKDKKRVKTEPESAAAETAAATASASAAVEETVSVPVLSVPFEKDKVMATIFYGDSVHTVTPLEQGYRLTLSFFLKPEDKPDEEEDDDDEDEDEDEDPTKEKESQPAPVSEQTDAKARVVDQKVIDALVETEFARCELHVSDFNLEKREYSTTFKSFKAPPPKTRVLNAKDRDEKALRAMGSPLLDRYINGSDTQPIIAELERRLVKEGSICVILDHKYALDEIQQMSKGFTKADDIPLMKTLRAVSNADRPLLFVPVVVHGGHTGRSYDEDSTYPSTHTVRPFEKIVRDRALFKYLEIVEGEHLTAFGWWRASDNEPLHYEHEDGIENTGNEARDESDKCVYIKVACILLADRLFRSYEEFVAEGQAKGKTDKSDEKNYASWVEAMKDYPPNPLASYASVASAAASASASASAAAPPVVKRAKKDSKPV